MAAAWAAGWAVRVEAETAAEAEVAVSARAVGVKAAGVVEVGAAVVG